MKAKIIAKRYAKAFFEEFDKDNFENLLKDISILKNVLSEKLIVYLNAPIINLKEKFKVIESISEQLNFAEKWKMLLEIMEKKRRISVIMDVLNELEKFVYSAQDKEKVKIYLAHKESSEIIQKIAKKVAKLISKEVVPEIHIKPSLLGGFLVETERYHIDGSVQGNLIRLKKVIEQD